MLRVMSGVTLLNLVAIGLLVAFAWFCGAMLKSARMPGWAVMGGILAGLLLGPGVFGRIIPVQVRAPNGPWEPVETGPHCSRCRRQMTREIDDPLKDEGSHPERRDGR